MKRVELYRERLIDDVCKDDKAYLALKSSDELATYVALTYCLTNDNEIIPNRCGHCLSCQYKNEDCYTAILNYMLEDI